MKLVTTKFKSGGLYDKHVVTTWNLGKLLGSVKPRKQCVEMAGEGPSEY